jgi:hypothetical protein
MIGAQPIAGHVHHSRGAPTREVHGAHVRLRQRSVEALGSDAHDKLIAA